jgi:hypothetical protein
MWRSGRVAVVGAALALVVAGCDPSAGSAPRRAVTQTAGGASTSAGFNAAGVLGGNAQPTFPASGSSLEVVARGTLVTGTTATIPVAVRNGTAEADAGGSTAHGTGSTLSPSELGPGEVGLVVVSFPAGTAQPTRRTDPAAVDFTVRASSSRLHDLKVSAVSDAAGSLTGSASEPSGSARAPYPVSAYCFDDDGALTYGATSFASGAKALSSGDAVSFAVGLQGLPCPQYVVGVAAHGAG